MENLKSSNPDTKTVTANNVDLTSRDREQITTANWNAASFLQLLNMEKEAYASVKSESISVAGDDVLVKPYAYTALALVIHELMTNATKHGALSTETGRVNITMRRSKTDGAFHIIWQESGGPVVWPPKRVGFGSSIINSSIPHDLDGKVEVRFDPGGFFAEFTVPARHISEDKNDEAQQTISPNMPSQAQLSSKTAMVLEDSLLIALDMQDYLESLGAATVHIASNVKQAMAIIADNLLDIAILDVNLGDETSEAVAVKLDVMDVPFVLATGYAESHGMSDRFPNVPVVSKPVALDRLRTAIDKAMNKRPS
jgi:CheY-like chemotaxis protein